MLSHIAWETKINNQVDSDTNLNTLENHIDLQSVGHSAT